jgi:hypothetical protein
MAKDKVLRWRARLLLLAMAVAQSSMGIMNAKTPPEITVESPLPWLQILRYGDPAFSAKLAEAVSPAAATQLATVLPYSVLVSDNGPFPLSGIAIRFSLRNSGKAVDRDFFYHSFGQSNRPVIPVRGTRLFTPLKTANALAAGARSVSSGGHMGALSSPNDAGVLASLAAAESIHVSIDLAIEPSGRFAGPDKTGTVGKLNKQVDAYRVMRDACLSRLGNNDSDESLMVWLASVADQKVFRVQGSTDRSAASQKEYASAWLGLLKAGRRSDLQALVSKTPAEMLPAIVSLKGGLQ